MNKKPLQF